MECSIEGVKCPGSGPTSVTNSWGDPGQACHGGNIEEHIGYMFTKPGLVNLSRNFHFYQPCKALQNQPVHNLN